MQGSSCNSAPKSRHKDHRGEEIQDGEVHNESDESSQYADEYLPDRYRQTALQPVAGMSILTILCHTSGNDVK